MIDDGGHFLTSILLSVRRPSAANLRRRQRAAHALRRRCRCADAGRRAQAIVDQHQAEQQRAPPPLCATATGSGRCSSTLLMPRPICSDRPSSISAVGQTRPPAAGARRAAGGPGHAQRADPVGHVDRRARVAVELAAEVVGADVLGQVEAVGEVHPRPPLAMAGGQVDAGHRRIVAADPAAEGDLADHQEQGQPRQSAGRRR